MKLIVQVSYSVFYFGAPFEFSTSDFLFTGKWHVDDLGICEFEIEISPSERLPKRFWRKEYKPNLQWKDESEFSFYYENACSNKSKGEE